MNDILFTFAHVTDSHLYDVSDSPVYERPRIYGSTLDCISPLVESLNAEREHPLPDFVALCGDIIDGGIPGPFDRGVICDRQVRRLKGILASLKTPATAKQPICWTGLADETHPTDAVFHSGLPHERDFTVPYV